MTRSLNLEALSEMRVTVSALIGRAHLPLGEILELGIGSVVPLQAVAGDAFPLTINGVTVGSGDIVTLENGSLGLLIQAVALPDHGRL